MDEDELVNGRLKATLPRWLVIGFSGHRRLHGKDAAVEAAVKARLGELAKTYPRLAGVCSAASGSDTIFAEAMVALDAPLRVVLPFNVQRFRQDFPPADSDGWDRAAKIIHGVPPHRIEVVHQLAADVAPIKEQALSPQDQRAAADDRDAAAYYEATVRTIDRCDLLLAVWNGEIGEGSGGTADAVSYATSLGKPVIIYNPAKAAFTRDLLGDDHGQFADYQAPSDSARDDPRARVIAELARYNALAEEHQKPTQTLMQICVYLHLLASAGAAVAVLAILGGRTAIFPALFELVVLCVVYTALTRRAEHHHRWFTNRIAAEICRTFLATWDVRRHPAVGHRPRQAIADHIEAAELHRPPSLILRLVRSARRVVFKVLKLQFDAPEPLTPPEHLFRTLRFLRDLDEAPLPELATVRGRYVAERLTDGPEAQIPYFNKKFAEASRRYRFFTVGVTAASFAAAAAAAMVVFILLINPEHEMLAHAFEFAGIVLPLVATAFTFLMVSSDATRRAHRYSQMVSLLNKLLPTVRAAPTWDALARAVTEVEEELLQEIVEWQSFVHYTEHLH